MGSTLAEANWMDVLDQLVHKVESSRTNMNHPGVAAVGKCKTFKNPGAKLIKLQEMCTGNQSVMEMMAWMRGGLAHLTERLWTTFLIPFPSSLLRLTSVTLSGYL